MSKKQSNRKNTVSHQVIYAGMAVFIIVLLVLVALKKLPAVWLMYYLVINSIAYTMYWHDKRAAQKRQWRVSEKALLTVSVLGGWMGAWQAQQQFRHKTKKVSFKVQFYIAVLVNMGVVLWVAFGNGADVLLEML